MSITVCCKLLQYTVCQMLWKSVSICRNYSQIKKGERFLGHGVERYDDCVV